MPSDTPSGDLFHYISAEGLSRLIQSKSLLFTHINYTTDSDQFYQALDLIKEVMAREYPGLSIEQFTLSRNSVYPVYKYSLFPEKDLCGRWLSYSNYDGYSYSLAGDQIAGINHKHGLQLRKCIYDRAEQINFIKDSIIAVSPEVFAKKGDSHNYLDPKHLMHSKTINSINRNILNNAAIIKNIAAKTNNEWIIFPDNSYGVLGSGPDIEPYSHLVATKVRLEKNNFIPYWEIPLPSFKLKEVVIGPRPEPILSFEASKLLINDPGVNITNSKIIL